METEALIGHVGRGFERTFRRLWVPAAVLGILWILLDNQYR